MVLDKKKEEKKEIEDKNEIFNMNCCSFSSFDAFLQQELGQSCCGNEGEVISSEEKELYERKIKEYVKERYASLVKKESPSCCTPAGDSFIQIGSENKGKYVEKIGYSEKELEGLPEDVTGISFGCGNPTAIANLKPGETVLDLGSGGGIDVFLAAKKVGDTGKAIGLDMTPEMIDVARSNAKKLDLKNVEFKLGEMETIPLSDNSVDVTISNCVINLSPDKSTVFQEVFRVLKPNGRMVISDIVLNGQLPEVIKKSIDAWSSCVSGALEEKNYLQKIRDAGFIDVEIESKTTINELSCLLDSDDPIIKKAKEIEGINLKDLANKIFSIKVRAKKPE